MGNVPTGVLGIPLPVKVRVASFVVTLNTLAMWTDPGTAGTWVRFTLLPDTHGAVPAVRTPANGTSPVGVGIGVLHTKLVFCAGAVSEVPVAGVTR